MTNKTKVMSMDEAMRKAGLGDGSRILLSGFVGAGEPTCCIEWMVEKNIKDLTVICNTPGMNGFGKAMLFKNNCIKELISSHVGTTAESTEEYVNGRLYIEQFYPMGTWAEKVRAGAVGLGGVLVPVGVGILDKEGLFPEVEKQGKQKEIVHVNGMDCIVEPALTAPIAMVQAWRADEIGNLQYRGTSRNNNHDMAMAGTFTIAEVSEIVPVGTIPPENVGTPGPFIDAIVQGLSIEEHDELYRRHWLKIGKLAQEN